MSNVISRGGWSECPTCSGWGAVLEHPGGHVIIRPDTGQPIPENEGLVSVTCPTCGAHLSEMAAVQQESDGWQNDFARECTARECAEADGERLRGQVASLRASLIIVRSEPEQTLQWSNAWDNLDSALSDPGALAHDEAVRREEREAILAMLDPYAQGPTPEYRGNPDASAAVNHLAGWEGMHDLAMKLIRALPLTKPPKVTP